MNSFSPSGSPSSSPDSSPNILPRFVTPTRNNESPNTTPGSSPDLSGTFPRFVNPFKRGASVDISPPRSPIIASAIPKRLSVSFTGDNKRKSSVAEFHGDLKVEKIRKSRLKFWKKVLILSTVLLIGLIVGTIIGHWGIPYAAQMPSKTASTSLAPSLQAQHTSSSEGVVSASATEVDVKMAATAPQGANSISFWQPAAGTTFQIQLSTPMTSASGLPAAIQAYDVDLFDTPISIISGLKSAGKKVICYFSAGTAENWRSDYSKFQAADLGANMADWEGEKWVHTSNANVRAIMVARLQLAKSKGCDGVDPDNVDVYEYGTASGFTDLTQATSIDYLTYLAGKAHGMGLAIGLKNAGELISNIQPVMQWAITEQCAEYDECDVYTPFTSAGKPAFNIQYPFVNNNKKTSVTAAMIAKYCTGDSNLPGFTNLLKHMSLDSWLYQC